MARLTKEELLDTSRYEYATEEVELEELGGSVEVKVLSVEERDDVTRLIRGAQKSKDAAKARDKVAEIFSIVVIDPDLSVEEAKGIIGPLPAPAFDRVMEAFSDLIGDDGEEEDAETRSDFREEED